MTRDWIRLHRQSIDSQVFSDPFVWQLFCWCLLKANWKDGYFHGTAIPRGSFATGRKAAAEALNVSESKFRRGIKRLESLGCISSKATNRFSVIRIEKYDAYQTSGTAERPSSDQPKQPLLKETSQKPTIKKSLFDSVETDVNASHSVNGRPSSGHQMNAQATTIEEGKEGKKKKGFDPLSVSIPERIRKSEFERAWSDWIQQRKQLRKPLTEKTVEAQLEQFADWGVVRSVAAIKHTIRNGWQGIREPESNHGANSTASCQPRSKRVPV